MFEPSTWSLSSSGAHRGLSQDLILSGEPSHIHIPRPSRVLALAHQAVSSTAALDGLDDGEAGDDRRLLPAA